MSDFSTSFSDLKDKMSKLQAANAALEANTDPALDDALMLDVMSAVEDLSVSDADVNQISTQEQNILENQTEIGRAHV